MADSGHNILDLLNKSRGGIAYTLLDVETKVAEDVLSKITDIDGVLSVRAL